MMTHLDLMIRANSLLVRLDQLRPLIAKYELSTEVSTPKGYLPYLHCGIDCPVLLCLHVTD